MSISEDSNSIIEYFGFWLTVPDDIKFDKEAVEILFKEYINLRKNIRTILATYAKADADDVDANIAFYNKIKNLIE